MPPPDDLGCKANARSDVRWPLQGTRSQRPTSVQRSRQYNPQLAPETRRGEVRFGICRVQKHSFLRALERRWPIPVDPIIISLLPIVVRTEFVGRSSKEICKFHSCPAASRDRIAPTCRTKPFTVVRASPLRSSDATPPNFFSIARISSRKPIESRSNPPSKTGVAWLLKTSAPRTFCNASRTAASARRRASPDPR